MKDDDYNWANRIARLEEALENAQDGFDGFVRWSEAYPTDIFLKPDLKKAHELLQAGGMTLDAISAAVLRWAMMRIGEDARKARAAIDYALKGEPK